MPVLQRSTAAVLAPAVRTTALHRLIESSGLSRSLKLHKTLLELVDTTLIVGHDPAVGNLIAFITDPLAQELFARWGDHSPDAADLRDLSKFLATQKPFLNLRPIADAKSGRHQLLGELDRSFLLALLIERLPPATEDPDRRLFQLRVWIVIHAFMRYRRGIRLDGNIRTVCTALRLGCDTDLQWRALFLGLPPIYGIRPLREFNFRLSATAQHLRGHEQSLPKERRVLSALIELASNRDKEIKADTNLPTALFQTEEFPDESPTQTVAVELDDDNGQLIIDAENEINLLVTKPDPGFTQAERKLSARTVLFSTAEGMQHLPWSWLRPNPQEVNELEHWMDLTLASEGNLSPKALAVSLIWSACALGRTVTRVLAIRIDTTADDEWVFDGSSGEFRRLPPMRKPGWQPDEAAKLWISPVAQEISFRLPDRPRHVLMQAARRSENPRTLRELWQTGDTTPEQAIRECLHEVSGRLTGSMLANVLPQRIFDLQGDAVLARLISSHPQSALAGAHSYAQWSLDTVTGLLTGSRLDRLSTRGGDTALGSRVALLEAPLRAVIANARDRVREAQTGNPLILHNAFSAYIVIALLAATGGRPIRSPFESILNFDFDESLVFIDDKHGVAQQDSGRLVPLPTVISAFIRKRYLPHLLALSTALKERAPRLAREIQLTATSKPRGKIPFFFLIDPASLDWSEIAPSNVFAAVGIDWPLPANLFRHRLANRLRTEGLDPEIIDGLLGHGEWGNDTWSIYSFRSWADDVVMARRALDSSFRSLRFHPVRGLSDDTEWPATTVRLDLEEGIRYGSAARQRERNHRFIIAVRDTKFAIHDYLAGRKLEKLDGDALDVLADHLTRTSDGMPSVTGAIRLAYLERQLEKAERRTGRRVRPSSVRMFGGEEASLFNGDFRGAHKLVQHLLELLSLTNPTTGTTRSLGVALSLCLESRVTDGRLLLDVAANKGYRLLRLGEHCYLEYGEIEPDTDVAGRRFRISSRCAFWSIRAQTGRTVTPKTSIPAVFEPLARRLSNQPKEVGEMLHTLARLVAQANAQTLPGILCGALSGKVSTAALGWRDTTRLITGRRIAPTGNREGLSPQKAEAPFKPPALHNLDTSAKDASLTLLKACRRILADGPSRTSGTNNPRRTLLAELHCAIDDATQAGAAPAVLLLTQWIYFLARPIAKRTLAKSTLRRYLAALAWRFENEMLSFDLLESDGDELTDAYERILLSGDKPGGHFELERLESFHRWLQSSFDIESPDWLELPVVKPGLGTSAGFIRPDEYLLALRLLVTGPHLSTGEQVSAAMLLLLAYRFGLRRREALGLRRRDWIESAERSVVTVESNNTRKLKTASSRRQVPLVFALQPEESHLVASILTRYAARHGSDHDQFLLEVDDSYRLVSTVLGTLKKATGNPTTTIHHARHSAANLVAINALGLKLPGWASIQMENDVPSCLLGSKTPASRRHGWAIGRFLGHSSRLTTCRSYLHFLFDWADELIGIRTDPHLSSSSELMQIVSLQSLPEISKDDSNDAEDKPTRGSLAEILEAFRLYARGVRVTSIAGGLSLDTALVERCARLLDGHSGLKRVESESMLGNAEESVREVTPSSSSPDSDDHWSGFGSIARTLRDPAWNRLIAWARQHPIPDGKSAPDLNLEDFKSMLGRSGQLLAWREEHFSMLRLTLDHLKITDEQYQVFGSTHLHHGTSVMAENAGFKISTRPQLRKRQTSKRVAHFQIDSARTGPFNEPVLSRVALVFAENDKLVIRNRNQLALIMAAMSIATRAKNSQSGMP